MISFIDQDGFNWLINPDHIVAVKRLDDDRYALWLTTQQIIRVDVEKHAVNLNSYHTLIRRDII